MGEKESRLCDAYFLFLLHIILVVVVLLTMVSIAVHFMLLLQLLLLILVGPMVLLYHCTHYAMHGGRSSDGIGCGAFFIVVTVVASGAGWDPGAALS